MLLSTILAVCLVSQCEHPRCTNTEHSPSKGGQALGRRRRGCGGGRWHLEDLVTGQKLTPNRKASAYLAARRRSLDSGRQARGR
ncbi:hypothetical protein B0T25DRAFT_129428 [Lasiosphaeria hispida]|uniref:Secreted protein n=1 Tax=Lasiosphaeria hispida TaxID=260671 RepID=A0AAJ0HS35_9PEZI|nr:hypothetical protein B0T25DRAFT_129428 [Lasiosphaeria hispida]